MLSLYIISMGELCQGKRELKACYEEEFAPKGVHMQVRRWKDVFSPRWKPEDKDNIY